MVQRHEDIAQFSHPCRTSGHNSTVKETMCTPPGETRMKAEKQDVRLLVVDDDDGIREGLIAYFDMYGYDVVTARHGDEALEIVQRDPPFDAIFLDVVMPGKSGVEVLQAMHDAHVSCPIVLMTAYSPLYRRMEALGLGATELIAKPFALDDLDRLLDRLLEIK
jgi:DNA-binding NtrC family response regulator